MACAWTVVVGLVAGLVRVGADQAVMTDITLGFGQALEHCREESGLTEDKMEEFFHFWNEDFKIEERELGCALQCMSKHFNLMTDANRLHHDNALDFINSFPNGEVLAKTLLKILHDCEQVYIHEEDDCTRVLHIAACVRDTCRNAQLAPTMEMLLAEFIMKTEG